MLTTFWHFSGDSIQLRLVKCLIPAGIVPVDTALRVVSLLSTENIAVNVQVGKPLTWDFVFNLLTQTVARVLRPTFEGVL